MSPLMASIEIARSPDVVFAYVTDPARFVLWQENMRRLKERLESVGEQADSIGEGR